jgi:hypothetical protein
MGPGQQQPDVKGVVHHAPGAPAIIQRGNLFPHAKGAPAIMKPTMHPKLAKGMTYAQLFKGTDGGGGSIGSGSGDVVRPERVASIRHAGRSYEVHMDVLPGKDGGVGGRSYRATINGGSTGGRSHGTLGEAVTEMKVHAARDGWRAPLTNGTDFYGGPDGNASSHPSHPSVSGRDRATPSEFSGNSTSSGF